MYMNNDNYLQDFYNYNQVPNNCGGYMQNPNMMQNQPAMMNGMYMNPNMYQANNNQNITSFYPSTYRIINPVVSRVVQNSNYQFINEDTLNNMVDTVFSIVDGQIDYQEEEMTQTATQTVNANGQNNIPQAQRTTTEVSKSQSSIQNQNNRSDSLLRDIIKILIIKELLARRNNQYMNF